jgi:hypothetical protein
MDPDCRRAKLNQQMESMRKLRAERAQNRKLLDIRSVYLSEIKPRHYRGRVQTSTPPPVSVFIA